MLNTSEDLTSPNNTLKSQLASIYNLFAKYGSSGVPAIPENLTAWTTTGSVIKTDLTANNLTNLVPSSSDTSVQHNGVSWTKDTSSSTASQVVITGKANIYRTKFTSSGGSSSEYQTHFGTEAGKTGKAKIVDIKITINNTSSTGR